MRALATLLAAALCSTAAPPPRKLTLDEAIDLAVRNNRAITIAIAKTEETKSARRKASADYYPQVSNTSSYTHFTETDVLQFAQGSFGTFPGLGSLPSSALTVKQGDVDHFLVSNQVVQPLTQMFRIREGERIARADESVSRADLEGLRNQISLTVRQIYSGLIAARLDRQVASEQVLLADEQAGEAAQEVRRGEALEVSLTEARTRVLQAKQDELTVRIRQSDLFARFNEILGLPPGTQIEVDPALSEQRDLPGKEECIRLAQAATPEISAAEDIVKKAEAAVRASKFEYIPDVSVFARHDYQNGVAFLFHNYGVLGAEFSFKIFDGGKRRAEIGEREAQLQQAVQNLARLKEAAAANVEIGLDKIEQSRSLVDLATQIADLRTEAERIATAQQKQEVILHSKLTESTTALSKARADLTKARLAYIQAQAELEVILGRLPR